MQNLRYRANILSKGGGPSPTTIRICFHKINIDFTTLTKPFKIYLLMKNEIYQTGYLTKFD